MVSLLKNHQLENFRLAIVDLSSICFDFGLFSKNFLAPSVTFKFSRTKVITHALLVFEELEKTKTTKTGGATALPC